MGRSKTLHAKTRRVYEALPLRKLRRLAGDLSELIAELERGPRREIDIAFEHGGEPELVARVLRTEGDPQGGSWYQVERIFCSKERCPSCPHGDFRYRYRRTKKGKVTKRFSAPMGFRQELLEALRARVTPPVAAYEVIFRDGAVTLSKMNDKYRE